MSVKSKPKTELAECAEALRDVTLSTPVADIEEMITEGYLHLEELKAAVHCNPMQISALSHRLDHAEDVLHHKRRL